MKPTEFRINFILPTDLVLNQATLSSDFLGAGIEQVNWFKQNTLDKEEPLTDLDKHYIAAHDDSIKVLENAQQTAQCEQVDTGIKFSFAITNNLDRFAEINEEGKRPWLRQYLDDHILHYTLPSMLEKSFNWKNDVSVEDTKKFKNLHTAFKESLEKAYELKSSRFWIDGE
jgi:hypothetical protein